MKCLSKQILKEECKWFLLKWLRVVASESLIDGKTSQEFQIPVAFQFQISAVCGNNYVYFTVKFAI